MKFLTLAALAITTLLPAARVDAQLFYVGLRGGAALPTGAFGETEGTTSDALLEGAKSGFGYGLDAGINLGPLGFYAGFDQMRFDCAESSCAAEDGKYKLMGASAGVRLSVPLFPVVKPWIKGGVTFHELEADFGTASSFSGFTTERTPGYEVAAGFDIPFGGIFSITPQVRYVGQKLKYKVPGVTSGDESSEAANFFTFDLGLRLRSPL